MHSPSKRDIMNINHLLSSDGMATSSLSIAYNYKPTKPIRKASSWSTSLHKVKAVSSNERCDTFNNSLSFTGIAMNKNIIPLLEPRGSRTLSHEIFQVVNRDLSGTGSLDGLVTFVEIRQNAPTISCDQTATDFRQICRGTCPRNFSTPQDNGDINSHKCLTTCVAEQSSTVIDLHIQSHTKEALTRRKTNQGKEMSATQLSQCSNDKDSCVSSPRIASQFMTTSTGESFEDDSIPYGDYLDEMQYVDYKELDQEDDVDDNESFVFNLYLADDNDSVISDLYDSIEDDNSIDETQWDKERLIDHDDEVDSSETFVFDLYLTHGDDSFISQVTTDI